MDAIQDYLEIVKNYHLHRNPRSFGIYLKKLYKDIDFGKKSVLEIGAGNGLHSFYAAFRGARKVVAIEPEAAGSQSGFLSNFKKNSKLFNIDSVSLFPGTLQSFDNNNEKFDIIISHYSINHLDEESCINLKKNSDSKRVYLKIFSKLHSLLNENGVIIIIDCSNSNFFTKIGIKNPFAPSIEWKKHQHPNTWIELLKKAGFEREKTIWLPPYQLQELGYILLSNRLGSFLTHGHFAIFMKKDGHFLNREKIQP